MLPILNTLNRSPLTAVLLILAVTAVVLTIAAENAGDAAVGVGAFELAGQTDVDIWGREGARSKADTLHLCSAGMLQPCWGLRVARGCGEPTTVGFI